MQVTELKNEDLNFEVKVVLPSSKIANQVQKELDNLSSFFPLRLLYTLWSVLFFFWLL